MRMRDQAGSGLYMNETERNGFQQNITTWRSTSIMTWVILTNSFGVLQACAAGDSEVFLRTPT
jgi:hypothetical protein